MLLITAQEVKNVINLTNGKIFRINFKKADGTIRKMICRTSVKKGVNGNGHAMSEDKQAIRRRVFDMQKGEFRTIPIDRVIFINFKSHRYIYASKENWPTCNYVN